MEEPGETGETGVRERRRWRGDTAKREERRGCQGGRKEGRVHGRCSNFNQEPSNTPIDAGMDLKKRKRWGGGRGMTAEDEGKQVGDRWEGGSRRVKPEEKPVAGREAATAAEEPSRAEQTDASGTSEGRGRNNSKTEENVRRMKRRWGSLEVGGGVRRTLTRFSRLSTGSHNPCSVIPSWGKAQQDPGASSTEYQ